MSTQLPEEVAVREGHQRLLPGCRYRDFVVELPDVTLVGDRWAGEKARSGSSGNQVLLLHGGGQTRWSWNSTAAAMARQGWDVVTVDARGHGESSWDPSGKYSLDLLVADLRAVVAHLGGAPVLVGASMGGITATVAQGEGPSLGQALVLVDIAPRVDPNGARRIVDFMSSHLDGFESLAEVAEAVARYSPHRTRQASPERMRKNVRMRGDGRWYWHWDPAILAMAEDATREANAERMRRAATKLDLPTLLVRGTESEIVTETGSDDLRDLVPSVEVVEVAGAGHMVAGDDNDSFTDAVLSFLTSNESLSQKVER